MKSVIYLHGFNSSPQSEKAKLTHAYLTEHTEFLVHVPALTAAPLVAIASLHQLIEQVGVNNLAGFIGSSLGGFYSLYLQYYYSQAGVQTKAVLINPAIRPYELLLDYLGENQNPYTGERYHVDHSHMAELQSLVVEPLKQPQQTLLLTQTHDEVLDYQQAVSFLDGSSMWIHYGGSHAFDGYQQVLPSIKSFLLSA